MGKGKLKSNDKLEMENLIQMINRKWEIDSALKLGI